MKTAFLRNKYQCKIHNVIFSATVRGLLVFGAVFCWQPSIIFANIVHEIGHALASWATGVTVMEIGIDWHRAFCELAGISTRAKAIIVILGGVMANFITAAIAYHFDFNWYATCSILCGVINLIPFAHSDGDHLMNQLHNIYLKKEYVNAKS